MKRIGLAIILLMALALFSCGGGGSSAQIIHGDWEAGLTNPDGTAAFAFTATLAQNGKTVNVTKFSLTLPSSCFGAETAAVGLFTSPYTTHGVTSGNVQMTVQSDPASTNGMNTLALDGKFLRNVIWGTWTLIETGALCTEPGTSRSGTFIMTQK
jgi:hypothetical protein